MTHQNPPHSPIAEPFGFIEQPNHAEAEPAWAGVHAWQAALRQQDYHATPDLARMVELAVRMGRPLLLEGPAGSGKTSLALALAKALSRELVRLQCFEGMDATQALYDWNVHKQFAALTRANETDVFTEEYLLARPLMKALQAETGAILLIDEVDRSDEALEALLLEVLGEWQISVPEWKTITARIQPITILTSNRSRTLSDALRRRCLFVHLPFPDEQRELEIVQGRVTGIEPDAARRLVEAVQHMRSWPLAKAPGVAETLDWCQAWCMTDATWDKEWLESTLGCVIKDELDLKWVRDRLDELTGYT